LLEFSAIQTLAVAILAYFIGRKLTKRFKVLHDASVPEAVTGGLVIAVLVSIVQAFDIAVNFTMTGRDTLLLVVFAIVGLQAKASRLMEGGRPLLILVGLAVFMLPIQNFTGMGTTWLFGEPFAIGLMGGGVALSGGPGTVIALSPEVEALGFDKAAEMGIACAALGIVLGAVVGGPVGHYIIQRDRLKPKRRRKMLVGVAKDEVATVTLSTRDFLYNIFMIAVTIGLGDKLGDAFRLIGLDLPDFVSVLVAGSILSNVIHALFRDIPWPIEDPPMALSADVALNVFLAMALMSISVLQVIPLAHEIFLLMILQVATLTAFVVYVVYPLMGKDYDAAVAASGYMGVALGATPVGLAVMASVTRHHGASTKAMLIVPLIGLFFFDVINTLIFRAMLGLVT
jgi:ESS family glutamate:Na+ symporter